MIFFLGMTNYCRQWIHDLHKAFVDLKAALISASVLGLPPYAQAFHLHVSVLLLIMRGFAVIFVLAVLSGCHARSVHDPSPWEATVDKFNKYLSDLNMKADEVMGNIKSSQISRELDTLIQDSMSELAMYKENLQNRLAPSAQMTGEQLMTDMQVLVDKLIRHMRESQEQLDKYSHEFQTMMQQNVDDVRTRLSAYTRKLKKRLAKDTQEIQSVISVYFEEAMSRTTDNVQGLRERLDSYFAQVRDNTQAKITTLNDLLKTQAENLKEKIQDTTENIRERFEDRAQDVKSTLEDKVEELKEWFQPYMSMFRE